MDGRYRIEEILGGGGMATVYRATHEALDRPVALKVIAEEIRRLPGITERFLREARAATRLRGEHVVRVFDVGTTPDGTPYMAMELLEGRDLEAVLAAEGPLPVATAIDHVLQTCEALAEVHGAGIVHRDLKPANLFLTRGLDGLPCVKLIDFGVSRVGTREGTSPNAIVGSPQYMAPEQMESAARADPRSDIWALGVVLYELLTGELPYEGETYWDQYVSTMQGPPTRPSALRRDLPRGLDAVVLRCLRSDAEERWADVAALGAALAPFAGAEAAARAARVARVHEAARSSASPELVGYVDAAPGSRVQRRVVARPPDRRHVRLELATWALLAAVAGSATVLGARAFLPRHDAPYAPADVPIVTPPPPPVVLSVEPPPRTAARGVRVHHRPPPPAIVLPPPEPEPAPAPGEDDVEEPPQPSPDQLFEDRR